MLGYAQPKIYFSVLERSLPRETHRFFRLTGAKIPPSGADWSFYLTRSPHLQQGYSHGEAIWRHRKLDNIYDMDCDSGRSISIQPLQLPSFSQSIRDI